ncbi:uncharacterized protein K02A2.6-like, partial [Temnothorax curvispinosus]|uniref:RNA-directed DNA polymerase n=1 Tax=Temnothorax curvispinosus TaxID=300111 RepID=A0A6J1RFH9_9HYME
MAAVVLHGNFSIEIFDPTTTEWARWLQRFQAAVKIFKVPTEQQVLYLLHFIGTSAFDVICDKLAPADPYTATFDTLVTSLAEFYAPEPLEIAENFRFHQRKQKDGESVKDYVAALHKLSARCNFGAYLKTALRNQFVFGLASSRAQSRLLEIKDLTFKKAIQVATSMELSCGGSHLATKCTLDRSVKCLNCGTPGHLRKVCMAAKRAPANQVEEILVVEHSEFREKFFETITVEGKPLRFEVDSGAAVTIIVGVVPVMVSGRGTKIKLNLYVSNIEREPLLGREWIQQLHIRLTDTVNTINTSRSDTEYKITELLQQYRNKLDPHSTKIRGLQAKLTLKENAKPVFLKARTVPFKLLPLVDQELQALVSKGVLEKVNTSRWATPIVPVLKKDNTVRICGDFSVTINPCLLIDEHPLPTTDTLFANMAGGEKFSKIDLQQAYLQLKVREEDRELLTLNTHRGLFRSTRLMYGSASAPAIWQREMENLLQGIEGITVFLDDIRVTGPTKEIHLQRLKQNANADCLSRLPMSTTTTAERDVVDIYEIGMLHEMPVSADKIACATEKDVQLKSLLTAIREKKEIPVQMRFNINQAAYSVQQGVLLCNGKIVIPSKLRDRILRELHKNHFGVVKMKALARSLYWWPGIDKAIENLAKNCDIYAFSKWPFVRIVKNITAETTIKICKEIFTDYGIPKTMVMDNGRKLHYKIKLEDGRTWERHVDQIRKRGEQRSRHIEPYTGVYDYEPEAKEEPAAPRDAAEPNCAQRDQEEEQGPEALQPTQAREARAPDPGQRRDRPVR